MVSGKKNNNIGKEQENEAYLIFEKMGIKGIKQNAKCQRINLCKDSFSSQGDDLEIDFLLPFEKYCLLVDITSSKQADDIGKRIKGIKSTYNFIVSLEINDGLWKKLGVDENNLVYYQNIEEFKGIFILTNLEKYDVKSDIKSGISNLIIFYR